MRAILINVKQKKCQEVEVSKEDFLDDAYRLIGSELIETAFDFPAHPQANGVYDTIYVDAEGLVPGELKDKLFWQITGGHQPFAGNGLVVAVDEDGNSVGARIAIEKLESMVDFPSLADVWRILYHQ